MAAVTRCHWPKLTAPVAVVAVTPVTPLPLSRRNCWSAVLYESTKSAMPLLFQPADLFAQTVWMFEAAGSILIQAESVKAVPRATGAALRYCELPLRETPRPISPVEELGVTPEIAGYCCTLSA